MLKRQAQVADNRFRDDVGELNALEFGHFGTSQSSSIVNSRPIGFGSVQLASKTECFAGCFQRLSRVKVIESSRFMERAMGIEPSPKFGKQLNAPASLPAARRPSGV